MLVRPRGLFYTMVEVVRVLTVEVAGLVIMDGDGPGGSDDGEVVGKMIGEAMVGMMEQIMVMMEWITVMMAVEVM